MTFSKKLAIGWNTWNTYSVLSHVLLPEGLALNIGIKEYSNGAYLKDAFIGQKDLLNLEYIKPGIRSYDGSYTSLNLSWKGIEFKIESAVHLNNILILITPIRNPIKTPTIVLEVGILWDRPGMITKKKSSILVFFPDKKIHIFAVGSEISELHLPCQTPYFSFLLNRPIVISTGYKISFSEAKKIISKAKNNELERRKNFANFNNIYDAIQTCIAWNTIYDPKNNRVITPVSRIWNIRNGGYVLFCWDTFFAAILAAIDNKELAYANVIEILAEATKEGFIPNTSAANGFKTLDRSQPPVGSICCIEIFRKYGEKKFLEEVFEPLLKWNRWWPKNRETNGLLCWGSNFYKPLVGNEWETTNKGVHRRFGASLESGLDNSPMYDDIPFNNKRNQLCLQDAGLNGLYIADCDALAQIAKILNKKKAVNELEKRAEFYRNNCRRLWSEKDAIFLNRRTDKNIFSKRISPTNFYPMLGKVPTEAQVKQMMKRYFWNPEKFAGEWMLPSISRDDIAFKEQKYWRGKIWAPMNYLVYLGMLNYNLPKERKTLSEKSKKLLLNEWLEMGHVHENYSAITGTGCNQNDSDSFYHWGGLLGLIAIIEESHLT